MPDKDHTEISFLDQLKPEPHPRWFLIPSGNFNFEFSDELPRHVYMGVPPWFEYNDNNRQQQPQQVYSAQSNPALRTPT